MPISPDTTDRNTAVGVYRAVVAARDHQKACPDCPLTPRAMRLWRILASHVGYDGACFPGRDVLCEEMGASKWTVRRATAELVAHNVVDVLEAHGRGRRNTYRLDLAPTGKGCTDAPYPDENRPEKGAAVHPIPPVDNLEKGAPVLQKGAPVLSHIGEVRREVEERARVTIDNTGTLHPSEHPGHDDDWLNRWRDSMKPADTERCPNRPTSLPAWCGDDCPDCHGVGYVRREAS